MNSKGAKELGKRLAACVQAGEIEAAYDLMAPVLAARTPFARLGLVGGALGTADLEPVNAFLEHIAMHKTEGGCVVIGTALGRQLDRDLPGALERCRHYVIAADVWYGADILGERVPGPALVNRFQPALELLAPWRQDENTWVRRTVGVAAHLWAKRARGAPELTPQAQALLEFMAPLFVEQEMQAVKGVGWGLKTLGRYYPDLVTDWLAEEVIPGTRPHRALMLRKALTYLSASQRARVTGAEG